MQIRRMRCRLLHILKPSLKAQPDSSCGKGFCSKLSDLSGWSEQAAHSPEHTLKCIYGTWKVHTTGSVPFKGTWELPQRDQCCQTPQEGREDNCLIIVKILIGQCKLLLHVNDVCSADVGCSKLLHPVHYACVYLCLFVCVFAASRSSGKRSERTRQQHQADSQRTRGSHGTSNGNDLPDPSDIIRRLVLDPHGFSF